MNRIVLSILLIFCVCNLHSQSLTTTRITDWNKLPQSGFYDCIAPDTQNIPYKSEYQSHFLGVNVALSSNATFASAYAGQLLFSINYNANSYANVYVRSTNVDGQGAWARLIHSKGNQAIAGMLTVEAVEVKINTGADFVFEPTYNLKPLSEVEAFVNENKHLPDIPSEQEMKENGLNLNDMQIKLLQKIEELTLYTIQLEKRVKELEK
ncbi:MAG: hypothetical protein QM660_06950 [Dysgonomonas sp.]